MKGYIFPGRQIRSSYTLVNDRARSVFFRITCDRVTIVYLRDRIQSNTTSTRASGGGGLEGVYPKKNTKIFQFFPAKKANFAYFLRFFLAISFESIPLHPHPPPKPSYIPLNLDPSRWP
jgi:hypothetical protein